jgi:hypothetical protein
MITKMDFQEPMVAEVDKGLVHLLCQLVGKAV